MKGYARMALILLCMITLIGCTRVKIIEQLSILHVFGFDKGEHGELIGTGLFPDYTKSGQSTEIQLLVEEGASGTLLTQKMNRHATYPVQLSKIRVIVFGKKFAEEGIDAVINRLVKTPQLATKMQVIVTEQSAEQFLKAFKHERSLTLADRVQQNMNAANLPRMNLHYFLNQYYGAGQDAYVPMLTIGANDIAKVSGIAIFKKDRLKLHISEREAFIFSVIKDVRTQGVYEIKLKGDDPRGLLVSRGYRSYKNWNVTWKDNSPSVHLKLNLKWALTQSPAWLEPSKKEHLEQIKTLIAKEVETDVMKLLNKLQKHEVDPIGIGNIVRVRDRKWEEASFYRMYPDIPFHVEVKVSILHSGLES
jgi:spore germination protein